MQPTAVVMNMFYTGLGIARSLGERGIPVVGLSAQRRVYGNVTRYARVIKCPDSKSEAEALLSRMLELGEEIGHRAIVFPTRDDDVVFLDRYRSELSSRFILTVPESSVIRSCLDKSETAAWANRVGVRTPWCRVVESEEHLRSLLPDVEYPCVLKPVAAYRWRQAGNWQKVGGRKAIGITSEAELLLEYKRVAEADPRVLLQGMVPGGDDGLLVAACYFNRQSGYVAGFNAQKLVQLPDAFGTGCVLQTVDHPQIFEPTIRLLTAMRFTGIAEVEYKWDSVAKEYSLIEVNPRPWDQHSLGRACGIDLIYQAYCEHAGRAEPVPQYRFVQRKWIAEDAFVVALLRLLWRRDRGFSKLLRFAKGKRTYAIWSWRDPMPALSFLTGRLIPELATAMGRVFRANRGQTKVEAQVYGKSHS